MLGDAMGFEKTWRAERARKIRFRADSNSIVSFKADLVVKHALKAGRWMMTAFYPCLGLSRGLSPPLRISSNLSLLLPHLLYHHKTGRAIEHHDFV